MVYAVGSIVPVLLWSVGKCMKIKGGGLVKITCIYGYSHVLSIPIFFVCIIFKNFFHKMNFKEHQVIQISFDFFSCTTSIIHYYSNYKINFYKKYLLK